MRLLCDSPLGAVPATSGPDHRVLLESRAGQPFFYAIAENLGRVSQLPREEHLAIWKRVIDLYKQGEREIPESLQKLCQPPFVEALLENEIFWGLAGVTVGRAFYAQATEYLPAVYATAALLAAGMDHLPLIQEDDALLHGPRSPHSGC